MLIFSIIRLTSPERDCACWPKNKTGYFDFFITLAAFFTAAICVLILSGLILRVRLPFLFDIFLSITSTGRVMCTGPFLPEVAIFMAFSRVGFMSFCDLMTNAAFVIG